MIFVDPTFEMSGPRGHKQWCHMGTNDLSPEGLEELHAMARKIGMKREWFQGSTDHKHYDLVPSKRAKAVKFGAIELASTVVYSMVCGSFGWAVRIATCDDPESKRKLAEFLGQDIESDAFQARLVRGLRVYHHQLEILHDHELAEVLKYAVPAEKQPSLF